MGRKKTAVQPVAKRLPNWDVPADVLAIRTEWLKNLSFKPQKSAVCAGKTRESKVWTVGRAGETDDIFGRARSDGMRSWAFAVMSSAGKDLFLVSTDSAERASEFFSWVEDNAAVSAIRYRAEVLENFRKSKRVLIEGYTIPDSPTPQLRWIYDQAAMYESGCILAKDEPKPVSGGSESAYSVINGSGKSDKKQDVPNWSFAPKVEVVPAESESQGWAYARPAKPVMSPNGPGFQCGYGEFHWRTWPLRNVAVCVAGLGWRCADAGLSELSRTTLDMIHKELHRISK